jgi:hypothetical protein
LSMEPYQLPLPTLYRQLAYSHSAQIAANMYMIIDGTYPHKYDIHQKDSEADCVNMMEDLIDDTHMYILL